MRYSLHYQPEDSRCPAHREGQAPACSWRYRVGLIISGILHQLFHIAILIAPISVAVVAAPVQGPDPTIISGANGDDGFFVFTTGKGVPILHGTDMVNWVSAGRVFADDVPAWAAKAIPGSRNVWGPDISFHDGMYHLFYAVSTFGSQRSAIGHAVNKRLAPGHPDNHWIDRGLVIDSAKDRCDFNAIDPNLFVDDSGKWILSFGSFWSGIKAVELDPHSAMPKGEPPVLYSLATRAANVPHRPIEAPFITKHRDWYYLFVSWDHCCNGAASDYKIIVARSRSAFGPYLDKSGRAMMDGGGSLMLEGDNQWAGPGHNGFIHCPKGDFLVHHAIPRQRPATGRLLLVRPLAWDISGWPSCTSAMNSPQPEN